VIDLCVSLLAQGVTAHIVTTNADGQGQLDVETGQWTGYRGVPTLFFTKSFSEAYKYSRALGYWLERHVTDYDLVHIHAIFSYATLAAGRCCIDRNIPYIIRPLGSLDPWSMRRKRLLKSGLLRLGLSRILRQASAIQYTSKLEQQAAESLMSLGSGRVVANAVSPLSEEIVEPDYENYILYLGRLHEKKKLPLLIERFAAARSNPAMEGMMLVIAGSGELKVEQQLRQVCRLHNCEDIVAFTGWIEGAEKTGLLHNAHLVVLISENENYGISVVEAMSAGIPVLINRGVYLYPDVIEADAGWVNMEDTNLSADLVEAIENKDASARKAANAMRLVTEKFSWPVVSSRMLSLYHDVLGK
jgi:glycosyltransferase involved in cell wall biosynthesis